MSKKYPYITCLMECSVDGRLDETRWSKLFDERGEGTPDVFYETFDLLSPECSLIGKTSVQKHCDVGEFKAPRTDEPVPDPFFRGIRSRSMLTAIFDSRGTLSYNSNIIFNGTAVAVLGRRCVSEAYLRHLREREVSYTFAGDDGRDLHEAVRSLREDFGVKNMVLSGGGVLNGSFLKAGLIDELYLVLYPGIDGLHGIYSIFEYFGTPGELPCAGQSLELLSCEQCRAGVVRLRYKFHSQEQKE